MRLNVNFKLFWVEMRDIVVISGNEVAGLCPGGSLCLCWLGLQSQVREEQRHEGHREHAMSGGK